MSVIDATCYSIATEKESGAGEMSCYKPASYGESASSYSIVSEIMNDVLDNAFEVIMTKQLQPTSKVEKITPNVVGDILENILSPRSNIITKSNDETVLLDDNIKQIIKEMKCPVEQKSIICTQGIGDQLDENTDEMHGKVATESPKRNTLERKNRLTNLVRNSKQMLVKLVANEMDNEVRLTKSEEINEKLLKVIDLEGDDHYVEPGCSSSTGILQMPPESTLHMIDLERNVHSEGETDVEKIDGSETSNKPENKKSSADGKKKWNLGAKIIRYLKRNKENRRDDK